jgi:hypothetical protein
MNHFLPLLLTLAIPLHSAAAEHQCTFQSGARVEARFPCEPAMVEAFGKRLLEIYPEVRQINTSPDYIMGLYTFAMGSCTGQFAKMTTEEIGANGEPFFPRETGAAIAKAGREVICPGPR